MDLFVCCGTFPSPRPCCHPCANAYHALREAGYEPNVKRGYGLTILPDALFNHSAVRREAKRLTGKSTVPVLVLDDGQAIADSKRIVEWAKQHPANG